MTRPILILACVAMLAGCSSMGQLSPAGERGGARELDPVTDDFASVVFALDLPDSVRPTEAGVSFSYDVNEAKAPAFLDTTLVRGDAEAVIGVLPAPAAGRSYHVFALSDPARTKLRALQAYARSLPQRPLPIVRIVPRLCLARAVDKAATSFAVLAVLPGSGALKPPIGAETLAVLEARSAPIATCG